MSMRKMFAKLAATFSFGGPLKFSRATTWTASLLSIPVLLAVLSTALPLAPSPTSAGEAKAKSMFGRLFPELPAYDAPSDEALTALTVAVGPNGEPGPLFDENLAEDNNPDNVAAFFTYLGQFLITT